MYPKKRNIWTRASGGETRRLVFFSPTLRRAMYDMGKVKLCGENEKT